MADQSGNVGALVVGGLAVATIGGVLAYSILKSRGLTPLPPPTPTGGCTTSSQCPSGYICVGGECVQPTGCSSSSQCPPNYVCENGACVPVGQCGTQGAPCSSTSQCCSGLHVPRRGVHELPHWYLYVFRVLGPSAVLVSTTCTSHNLPFKHTVHLLPRLAHLLFVRGDGGYIEVYRVLPEWLLPVRSLYESHRG